MSKQERKIKGLVKQKRRVKIWGSGIGAKTINKLKTMSTPCSCALCSPGKRLQNGLVKRTQKELQEARVEAYQYLIP
jgi:hypothetical protein